MNIHDQITNDVPRLMKSHKKSGSSKRKSNDKSLKVVYISSPMKVKTSATRFRALVQQLTGKNSDISQYIEPENYGAMEFLDVGFDEDVCNNYGGGLRKEINENKQFMSSVSSEDTPTSSDSFLGPMDDAFINTQMEEQFGGVFSSNSSFFDISHELDVLGSYDELL